MTRTPHFQPTRSVVVLVPPQAQLVGIVGLMEAFDAANRFYAAKERAPLYALRLVSVGPETASSAGAVLRCSASTEVQAPHTLVLGGAIATLDHAPDPAVVQEAGRLADGAERVVAICTGAFVLGELGMLDGRRCTSHWLALDRLRKRHPRALVQDDAIFTEDGRVYTSAGATAGIDLALHLIRQDGGPRLALAVAKALVVFAQRPGGQSQFGTALQLRPASEDRVHRLVASVVARPAGDHRVESMAARVGMSPRNFARVFREQTGETPAAFVAKARVEAAQRALVGGDATVASIAADCGFGSEETLRRTMLRVAGVSPSAYRARFRAGGPIAS